MLLNSLQKMVDEAIAGKLHRKDISETKLSSLEDSLKRYLEHSLLAAENQEKQNKITESLISDISHQTLTPISNIKIYSELLAERCEGKFEEIETISEQTEKLDFLIQSLVKLSRLETGIICAQTSETNISELFAAIKQTYGIKAQEKQISMDIVESDLMAKFDVKWTIEALGNVVDNAIKYMNVGGKIEIFAEAYSMFARIDVVDNGPGIKEDEINHIFARFYRSPEVKGEPGVGIGLYITRQILQAQNGYIKVSSQVGKGSRFSIFLPL